MTQEEFYQRVGRESLRKDYETGVSREERYIINKIRMRQMEEILQENGQENAQGNEKDTKSGINSQES